MNPQKKFHLVSALVMGAMMVFLMTFVITLLNPGWIDHFLAIWMKSSMVAYVAAVPLIFFLAPIARQMTGKLLDVKPA